MRGVASATRMTQSKVLQLSVTHFNDASPISIWKQKTFGPLYQDREHRLAPSFFGRFCGPGYRVWRMQRAQTLTSDAWGPCDDRPRQKGSFCLETMVALQYFKASCIHTCSSIGRGVSEYGMDFRPNERVNPWGAYLTCSCLSYSTPFIPSQ
jgi:hypothetical protein